MVGLKKLELGRKSVSQQIVNSALFPRTVSPYKMHGFE